MEEPGHVEEVHNFAAFVVGSGAYASHWMKPAIKPNERFAEELPRKDIDTAQARAFKIRPPHGDAAVKDEHGYTALAGPGT